MCRRIMAILLGIFLVSGWPHPGAAALDRGATPPYHNLALRTYFRDRLVGMAQDWRLPESAGQSALDPELDRRIDLLIADFSERLIRRMATLNRRLAQVEFDRHRLMPALRRGEASSLWQLRLSLNELRKAAADLRTCLAPVFPQEASTCGFRPLVVESDLEEGFEKQVVMLRSELERSERLIRQLILEPTLTVSLDDLRGPNMLVSLHRAERIAEALISILTRKATWAGSKRR